MHSTASERARLLARRLMDRWDLQGAEIVRLWRAWGWSPPRHLAAGPAGRRLRRQPLARRPLRGRRPDRPGGPVTASDHGAHRERRRLRLRPACSVAVSRSPQSSLIARREREREQRLLLQLVRLARPGGRARRRAPLHRRHARAEDRAEARHHVEVRAHVLRLLLHPHQLARRRVRLDRACVQRRHRERVELLEAENRRRRVAAALPLGAQLVDDLAGADQDAPRAGRRLVVGQHRLEAPARQLLDRATTSRRGAACSSA